MSLRLQANDADGDGRVSRAELEKTGSPPAILHRFALADADGDGALSREEHYVLLHPEVRRSSRRYGPK